MKTRSLWAGLAAALLAGAIAGRASAQCTPSWLPGQGVPGLSGTINAATVWDDGTGPALYVGGQFTVAGNALANNVAKWNGSSWSALGSGIAGTVGTLTVYNGQLIAGGDFISAGGVSAYNIAAWNGSSWSALGTGINSGLGTLTVYNGQLIAGGSFSTAGGVSAKYIAAWSGSSWSARAAAHCGVVTEGESCEVIQCRITASRDGVIAGSPGCRWHPSDIRSQHQG